MKKTLLALGIAVALLAALLLVRGLGQANAGRTVHVFDTAQVGSIERLRVTLQADSVTLVKHDGRWVVLPDSFPADTARVGLALYHLLRLQDKEIVSNSPDSARLMDFGLHAGEVKHVSWTADGKTERIHLGHTSGLDFNSTYWKHPDRAEVYRTPGNFTHEIGPHPGAWKDKTLFPVFAAEDVRSVGVRWRGADGGMIGYAVTAGADSTYTLTVPGDGDSVGIPAARGRELFTRSSQLKIDEIPDSDDPYRALAVADSPSMVLTIRLRNGLIHDLTVGLETDEHAYFAHPSHHGIVKMLKSRLDAFKKTPAQLLVPSQADPTVPGEWEEVTVPGGPE